MENIKCYKCGLEGNRKDFVPHTMNKKKPQGLCKKCDNKRSKAWRQNNKKKNAQYFKEYWKDPKRKLNNKKYIEMNRFGFDATEFIQDKSCEICNMTNEQHLLKYSERLHIHHIDNNGRHNQSQQKTPINNKVRMQILCRSCHVREDNLKNKRYKNKISKTAEKLNV